MLTACHAKMDTNIFEHLPSSTNAVESHNRLSKKRDPNILKVALMSTYKIDMANALEHIACTKGISTSYMDMSLAAREKRSKDANAARARKRSREEESEGPPDKSGDFSKGKLIKFTTVYKAFHFMHFVMSSYQTTLQKRRG